jgi:hypothetical protein
LVAAGLGPHKTASPEQFRQAVAGAGAGRGGQAPGRTVPHALGLDPVAAGAHFAGLNRFARLSEQAGLSAAQRRRLLKESGQGQVSAGLTAEIEASLRQRGTGLKAGDVIGSARALPDTLQGPMRVHLPQGKEATKRHNKKKGDRR